MCVAKVQVPEGVVLSGRLNKKLRKIMNDLLREGIL
jgi:hypothetical protein